MAKKAVEQTGLIPRSIIRTFDRFRKQLVPETQKLIIQEFRISRYQFLVSIKCLTSLIFIPLLINYFLKNFLLIPVTENLWNKQQPEIFLNLAIFSLLRILFKTMENTVFPLRCKATDN